MTVPAGAPRRAGRGTRRRAALTAVLACTVLLSGCVGGPGDGPLTASTSTSSTAGPRWSTPPQSGLGAGRSERERALAELLADRTLAVERGDRAAWLEPVAAALRPGQADVLTRMRAMGVTALRVVGVSETHAPQPSTGPGTTWSATATLSYRLAGFDTAPRTFAVDLTVSGEGVGAGGLTITAWAPSERPEPWDLAGLRVRRTDSALVLAVGPQARVDEIISRARVAARRVAAVWGTAEPSVWIAPASDGDAARLLGRGPAGISSVAAAVDGPLTPGVRAGADRIVIVPGAWGSLTGPGRDVVLTHELTHATVRASTTHGVPLWLSEGFAEYVAYRDVSLPERVVVRPALEAFRRDGLPGALPADADFDPARGGLQAAYGSALLLARTIAQDGGIAGLVRVYRDTADTPSAWNVPVDDPEARFDAALVHDLATERAGLVTSWRARIQSLLAE